MAIFVQTVPILPCFSLSTNIEKRSVKKEVAKNGVAQQFSTPSNISIAEYFQKINPSDKSFYKYIPKPFLQDKTQFSLKKLQVRKNFHLITRKPILPWSLPKKRCAEETLGILTV